MKSCPKCNFVLVDNDDPLLVLKMLRTRKRNGDYNRFPLLVADFYCKECEETIHITWKELDNDIDVTKCPKCGSPLKASVFIGKMDGFKLESYCFSCYSKLDGGEVVFHQK